ncbi:uncharacterized protein LOC124932323 [Impatiens glandulifera]|uniref:uncharacterized protein LOC124932323 n=1 Tax=Impatiens glandulifera TaxID=253017 RepID=UPI001FB0D437|nr:uncharacterized protein LOC124932323 [Impatiens glandulifera]
MYSSSYTPTYYNSLHESIASICKSILPFSFKKKRLPAIMAAEQLLEKQQSDNLKWQQDSFHQILKLMGLAKEGIVPESDVSAFRTHLLETLIASPTDYEIPAILKDKLLFLQELLYAKSITEDEYHSSKTPLLQRLAAQGAEIDSRSVIMAAPKEIKDENCLLNRQKSNSKAKFFGFKSPQKKNSKDKDGAEVVVDPSNSTSKNELGLSKENPFWNITLNETPSILMEPVKEEDMVIEEQKGKQLKSGTEKRRWGINGFKKWKNQEDDNGSGENSNPNIFPSGDHQMKFAPPPPPPSLKSKKNKNTNPFLLDFDDEGNLHGNPKKKLEEEEVDYNNPFWSPSNGSSITG